MKETTIYDDYIITNNNVPKNFDKGYLIDKNGFNWHLALVSPKLSYYNQKFEITLRCNKLDIELKLSDSSQIALFFNSYKYYKTSNEVYIYNFKKPEVKN